MSLSTQAQKIKHLDRKAYADRIQATANDLRLFQVDVKGDYEVTNEGAEYNEDGQHFFGLNCQQ